MSYPATSNSIEHPIAIATTSSMALHQIEGQLNDVGEAILDGQFYGSKSVPQALGYGIAKLSSKHGYQIMSKGFVKKGMVMTLQQSARLSKVNIAGGVTTLIEVGLTATGNPVLVTAGKLTGFTGQVIQYGGIGSMMGGPVGLAVGLIAGGTVWAVCNWLAG